MQNQKNVKNLTTLCYIEKDGCYLMMHRISKKNDVNKDKWIGVGGHFLVNESPEECLLREAKEETGLTLKENDKLFTINPLLFSSPGMTDESNALMCAVITLDDTMQLSQAGAVGSECFDGFELISKEDATALLKNGQDKNGIFYSVYTWAALMYFISDIWKTV